MDGATRLAAEGCPYYLLWIILRSLRLDGYILLIKAFFVGGCSLFFQLTIASYLSGMLAMRLR